MVDVRSQQRAKERLICQEKLSSGNMNAGKEMTFQIIKL